MQSQLDRLRNLTPDQRRLLLRWLAEDRPQPVLSAGAEAPPVAPGSAPQMPSSPSGSGRDPQDGRLHQLVAYIAPRESSPPSLDTDAVRDFLKQRLPAYMLPAAIVELPSLPRTPRGKVDRRQLPDPRRTAAVAETGVPPRNDPEKILLRIWQAVLATDQISLHDNFFEIGGDSILSIQVISRAREAGLSLEPKMFTDHPTIAALAQAAASTRTAAGRWTPAVGETPLTPIQHWFFDLQLAAPHHWNQARLYQLPEPVDPVRLKRAVGACVEHHDALRARFRQREGAWQQFVPPRETDPGHVLQLDLKDLSAEAAAQAMQREMAAIQRSLDLEHGPLTRFAWFHLPADQPARLLVVIHHLVVDLLSWSTLQEDLQRVYVLDPGEPLRLPPKTDSLRLWAERLREEVESGSWDEEVEFWQRAAANDAARRLLLSERDFECIEAEMCLLRLDLDAGLTARLLREANEAYNTRPQEWLLAALAASFYSATGTSPVRVDIESHGRHAWAGDIDVSRTVGWFTGFFPLDLQVGEDLAPGPLIKSIKEQLRQTPQAGFRFLPLYYLGSAGVRRSLRQLPPATLLFNFAGQVPALASGPLQRLDEVPPEARFAGNRRRHPLEINAYVQDDRLRLDWRYCERLYQRDQLEVLSQHFLSELIRLVQHACSQDAGGYTPSDFPEAGLDQAGLDRFLEGLEGDR